MTHQQWGSPTQSSRPGSSAGPGGNSWGIADASWPPPQFAQPQLARIPQGPGFGAPSLGQPHYAHGQFSPPPGRSKSPLAGLLLALIGLTLIALVGLVAANLITPSSAVAYQNDDYKVPPPDKNPPPLPVPESYAQAEQILVNGPFYAQAAPIPVRCDTQPVNVATADEDQLQSHFDSLLECLMRVWQPPVANAGFTLVRPTVTLYGKEITTKCGNSKVNASYCSLDQQIYFSMDLPNALDLADRGKWAADLVMAHEFAHALQGRTAIFTSFIASAQSSGSKEAVLELTRRLETQADCFTGMFIRAVSLSLGVQQSDLENIEGTFAAIGDDTLSGDPQVLGNHGLARSRKYWGLTGLGTSAVAKCNTFTASKNLIR